MPKSKRTDSSTTKSKIYLCAFANTDLIISAKRYYQMASALGVFEDIFIYNEWNLHKDFRDKMQDKFHQRGFGYWSWKPQVVLQSFEKMQEGDVLIYADIGCHFHAAQRDRILGYIKTLKANGGGGMAWEIPCIEKHYNKSDLLKFFNVLEDSKITDSNQRAGTLFFLEKTNQNIAIMKQWRDVFYNHFNLADDTPSSIPNSEGFIEHRHDQAIWSILTKIHNIKAFPYNEFEGKQNQFAIEVKRDKVFLQSLILPGLISAFLKLIWISGAFMAPKMIRKRYRLSIRAQRKLKNLYKKAK